MTEVGRERESILALADRRKTTSQMTKSEVGGEQFVWLVPNSGFRDRHATFDGSHGEPLELAHLFGISQRSLRCSSNTAPIGMRAKTTGISIRSAQQDS